MWCREEVSWVCFEMGEKRRGLQRCADMSSSLHGEEVRQTFLVRSSSGKQTSCRPQISARRRHKWPEVLLAKKTNTTLTSSSSRCVSLLFLIIWLRDPVDPHPVLSSKDETTYPFRQGKFPFYTRVCNFANYRIPFSRFLLRVLQFFRVHISQVNPLGLSRISDFELSCRAQDRRPDLDGIHPPSSDERSNLKNWKDNFFWLDDRCLPEDMSWRFKDQSMSFDLGDDFIFDQEVARALIEHMSPIRPLHEHFLLLGRLCFSWSQGDRNWSVIRRKSDRVIMSLRDALKVPSFDVFDFDLEDQGEDEVPLMKQVASSAQEIRPIVPQNTSEQAVADTTSSVPTPIKETARSSESQAGKKSILDDVDNDPKIRSLDDALEYRSSSTSLKSKGIMHEVDPKALVRKRKTEFVQIRSFDPLPMSRVKKVKKGSSRSDGDVMIELDEHLMGGKFSREEAALARSEPTPAFSGGFLPTSEVESMDTEVPETVSKEKEKAHEGPKAVTFSGTILGSSLGPDCFLDDEEDQVSFLPSSWFGPELMSFFRYADVFSDEMEIDPATAEEKFVPDWDIWNKDSVMDELVAHMLLFDISTPLDHARSRRMKSQDLGTASVRDNLEKETRSLKCKIQRTPETDKKISQLTADLQAQQEKIKFLTTQSQSSQAAAASAAEDMDRIAAKLKNLSESMQKKDPEHKTVLAKMEESFNNARLAYANMMAAGRVKNRGG
ncbi:hypothetical protein Hanom_Chr05g00429941 [Helianthus anomalus]